jgi:hypothetical protein
LHRNEGEEDKRGSKQRFIAAHHRGNAPPPAPRRCPDIVVSIARIRKEERARGRAEAADALFRSVLQEQDEATRARRYRFGKQSE